MDLEAVPSRTHMLIGRIDARYGDAKQTAPPWSDVESRLTDAQLYWLITVRRDGRPHAVPLCGVWHGGAFYFCTGAEEQKMRNLQTHPHVAVTAGPLGAAGWSTGKDIVVEGIAERVTDPGQLERLAHEWATKYRGDWQFAVSGTEFVEITEAGVGTHGGAQVFRVLPTKCTIFGDQHGQTTYRSS